jgi:hypothetical protein
MTNSLRFTSRMNDIFWRARTSWSGIVWLASALRKISCLCTWTTHSAMRLITKYYIINMGWSHFVATLLSVRKLVYYIWGMLCIFEHGFAVIFLGFSAVKCNISSIACPHYVIIMHPVYKLRELAIYILFVNLSACFFFKTYWMVFNEVSCPPQPYLVYHPVVIVAGVAQSV